MNKTIAKTISISTFVLIADQLSKYFVTKNIEYATSNQVLDNIISFTKVYNTGAAFSLMDKHPTILAILSILAVIVVSYYFYTRINSMQKLAIIGWSIIIGGTLGNLHDRIVLGHVVDFIKLDFINFPIFNIADICINIGALLLILNIFLDKNEIQEENAE